MRNKYHEKLYLSEKVVTEEDLGKNMISHRDINDILREIRDAVNEVFHMFEPIKGLEEINKIKDKVKKLGIDLY